MKQTKKLTAVCSSTVSITEIYIMQFIKLYFITKSVFKCTLEKILHWHMVALNTWLLLSAESLIGLEYLLNTGL